METREYLLMFLSKRDGGYGLPKGLMNAQIKLSPDEQNEAQRAFLECDLYWPDHNVAVEYDGGLDHASYEQRARDAVKRNILQAQGKRVFTITARQILNADAFDAEIRNIANAISYKLRDFPIDWERRRDHLRKELFGSMGHACSNETHSDTR